MVIRDEKLKRYKLYLHCRLRLSQLYLRLLDSYVSTLQRLDEILRGRPMRKDDFLQHLTDNADDRVCRQLGGLPLHLR